MVYREGVAFTLSRRGICRLQSDRLVVIDRRTRQMISDLLRSQHLSQCNPADEWSPNLALCKDVLSRAKLTIVTSPHPHSPLAVSQSSDSLG